MIKAHFQTFAAYSAWANGRLYDACGQLPDEEYKKVRPAFFKSLHGTLNHILVGDRIWLARLQGDEYDRPPLDTELYEDLKSLRAARTEQDAAMASFVDGLNEGQYASIIVYGNPGGPEYRDRIRQILAHVFNHQTHHRGQAHDQLSQTSVEPPPLDLIYFMRLRERGEA